ncbi:MAG: DUF3179 domain-containing protein [Saprospiraceae bacterium]|nr:DUF3179 domain-containing protein [Lewinella sp.]
MITVMKHVKTTLLLLAFFAANSLWAQQAGDEVYCAYNGFEMTNLDIPLTEIFQAGPGKDGIPSLEIPRFVNVDRSEFLKDNDLVIGVMHNGVAKAYPIRIMNYHEVINDQYGDESLVVTYSPLTATAAAFSADIDGKAHTFGVSGLLYNNNLLIYDWETESLWSQMKGQAVTGQVSGKPLQNVVTNTSTWAAWKAKYPDTKVLSPRTGYKRNYEIDPYAMFGPESRRLMFPVARRNKKLPLKEQVVGLNYEGVARAYPLALLKNTANKPLQDNLNGLHITIQYDAVAKSVTVKDDAGHELPAMTSYWYAWSSIFPDTDIHGFLPQDYNLAMQFLTGGK